MVSKSGACGIWGRVRQKQYALEEQIERVCIVRKDKDVRACIPRFICSIFSGIDIILHCWCLCSSCCTWQKKWLWYKWQWQVWCCKTVLDTEKSTFWKLLIHDWTRTKTVCAPHHFVYSKSKDKAVSSLIRPHPTGVFCTETSPLQKIFPLHHLSLLGQVKHPNVTTSAWPQQEDIKRTHKAQKSHQKYNCSHLCTASLKCKV